MQMDKAIDIFNFIPVKGYAGHYEICAFGIIRSIKRDDHLLRPCFQKRHGYYHIMLRKNGEKKQYRFHRLVAEAFIKNPENKPEVNHINGDKTDNRASNLEWATASENMRHSFAIGLRSHKGEKCPSAKLTNSDANRIRFIYNEGKSSQKDIASYFGVTQSRVSEIVNNKAFCI